ncbi:hypothetical protein F5X68DRAFT_217478 [Plectosphaerella plurivora]|uniref:Uncharacterized protein n=1 Tax=Plectosphaerella plurivora TaxID=936078 RepID=A0A9P8V2N6_9PEZI|nr:hypothetical protein F5X68DRAFT_217478 [Plectosphaerella plurivora]
MSLTFLFPQLLLPRKFVELGRFITDIEHPHQSHHDPEYAKSPEAIVSYRYNFTGTNQQSKSSAFASGLTALFSSTFSKRAKTSIRVEADAVTTYTLSNSDDWFAEAVGLHGTRKWYERAVDKGYVIYMIVGFHTVTDARIYQELVHDSSNGAEFNIPVSLSLATMGAVVPFGELIDPAIGGQSQGLKKEQSFFVAPGEQVCAFQYRRIKYQWLSSNVVDTARLSKPLWWFSVESIRAEDPEDDDIIEVELVSEMGEVDGTWESTEVEPGQVIFSCVEENSDEN